MSIDEEADFVSAYSSAKAAEGSQSLTSIMKMPRHALDFGKYFSQNESMTINSRSLCFFFFPKVNGLEKDP